MEFKKKKYLLLIMAIVLIGKLSSYNLHMNPTSENLLELIRSGYDLVDQASFSKICKQLNDSVLKQLNGKTTLELLALTHINEYEETIDWGVVYSSYNDEVPPGVPDRLFLNVNITKEGKLKVQNLPAQISDIQDLAVGYIFSPSSSERKITHKELNIDQVGKFEISKVCPVLAVNIKKDHSFSISKWQVFFSCLRELIELYETERNKISLEIWGKEYRNLVFEKQLIITDIVSCNIYIRFY